ncbi:MAG: methyltransferase domain-containing protein, partial [Thermoproteus sp.]
MILGLVDRIRLLEILGTGFFKSVGGLKVLRIWRRWNEYYAGLMVRSAETCGWSPDEVYDDVVWRTLSAVYRHAGGRFPKSPPKELPEAIVPLIKLLKWAAERICDRNAPYTPEARAKYAEMLRAPIYRMYRQSLYSYYLVPLIKRGLVESVLSVGGGLIEPADLLELQNRHKAAFRITVQEVNPAVAKAVAAAGFEVFLGEVDQIGESFDFATVQAVLHWADDPVRVLSGAARVAKYVLVSQGYGPHNAAITIATAVMGARRYIADWREVEGWIEAAGLRP